MNTEASAGVAVWTVALAVAALATVAAPAAVAQDGLNVTQSVSERTVAPGDTVTVDVTVAAPDLSAPGLDADLDPRWPVAVETSDGARYRGERRQWIWTSGGTYEPRYTATIPGDAAPGDYLVVAEGSAIDRASGVRRVTVLRTRLRVTSASGVNATNGSATRPNATFVADTFAPNVSESVGFDASASSDPDGEIVEYRWWFGEAANASGVDPTQSFAQRGSYLVTLEVEDDDGNRAIHQEVVTVGASQPPAQAPVGQPSPVIAVAPGTDVDPGTTVVFNGSASSDAESAVTTYEWDLDGDGSYDSTGPVVERRYDEVGNVTVALRVTDESGATATVTERLTVGDPGGTDRGNGTGMLLLVAVAAVVLAAAILYRYTTNE